MDVFGTTINTDSIRAGVTAEINSKVPNINGVLNAKVYTAASGELTSPPYGEAYLPRVWIPKNGFGIQVLSSSMGGHGVTFYQAESTSFYGRYYSSPVTTSYDLLVVRFT